MSDPMPWRYEDGGRAAAGYRGTAGDCAVRAAAIATGGDYTALYDRINAVAKTERLGKRRRTRSSARNGVHRDTLHTVLTEHGFEWISLIGIGTCCTRRLAAGELPAGRLVVRLSRHYAAVIDSVLLDTHDCARGGTRCVYGYWQARKI